MLEQYQWQNRLLLIFAPSESDPRYATQKGRIQETTDAIAERDMLVLTFFEDIADDDSQGDEMRSRFQVYPNEFVIALVGKDGTEKHRVAQPVEMAVFFDMIDQMPMRRREMRERSKG